jgi:WD40 repeat protein
MAEAFGIFISYRRADTQANALRLHEAIHNGIPEARVFIDLDGIGPGEQFEQVIEKTIAHSQVALVLIGENWSTERLNQPGDLHFREIEAALAGGLTVIPVLFNRLTPPATDSLPAPIRPLLASNASFISNYRWLEDADKLLARLRQLASEERPKKSSREFDYFDITKFHQEKPVIDVESELYCVEFSRDQSVMAAGSGDAAFVWPIASGAPDTAAAITLPHKRFVYSLVFTADTKTLITGSEDSGVRFWDWRNKEELHRDLKTHSGAVYAVAISGDGTYLATGDYNGLVQLWNGSGSAQLTEQKFRGAVSSLAFSPRGDILAVGTHEDETLLWDLAKGEAPSLGRHESSVESLAFSPDGSRLVSCGLDKYVRLWDVDTLQPVWARKQHKYVVKSVAFSPDGKVIASAGWDKTVRLWDVAGKEFARKMPFWVGDEQELEWHTDWIWAASFSPDGDMLASAGSDGKLIVWTIPSKDLPSFPQRS